MTASPASAAQPGPHRIMAVTTAESLIEYCKCPPDPPISLLIFPFQFFPAGVLPGQFDQGERKPVGVLRVEEVGPSVYTKGFVRLLEEEVFQSFPLAAITRIGPAQWNRAQ